jgi:hypothetical protein
MKLYLLFITMDLLTFLAYPIVFAHSKLRLFSKTRESAALANVEITSSIISVTAK